MVRFEFKLLGWLGKEYFTWEWVGRLEVSLRYIYGAYPKIKSLEYS